MFQYTWLTQYIDTLFSKSPNNNTEKLFLFGKYLLIIYIKFKYKFNFIFNFYKINKFIHNTQEKFKIYVTFHIDKAVSF